jgi:hypothetical protein
MDEDMVLYFGGDFGGISLANGDKRIGDRYFNVAPRPGRCYGLRLPGIECGRVDSFQKT